MDEHDLGDIAALPEEKPVLRTTADGRRFACVRRGDCVDVIDDRCPHEGYPLSQGQVRDGVLTCRWHNWKFELASGTCRFGGEPVRRYPARVEGGRVIVDASIDRGAERARSERSLRDAMREGTMGTVMRDALRLAALDGGSLHAALAVIASDAARRAPWGFEHGLAMLADVATWIEEDLVEDKSAFAQASALIAEPLLHAPERELRAASGHPARLLAALREERRDEARAIAASLELEPLLHGALLPFLAGALAEYGHGAIYVYKARELALRFPEHAPELIASVVVALSWATFESTLPGWGATAAAIEEVNGLELGDRPLTESAEHRARVLTSEKEAARACLARLREGVSPRALLIAAARAAAERLARFDDAWERRLDAPVTILDVSHALTFAEASLALAGDDRIAASLAVQASGFVGKLKSADGEVRAPIADVPLAAALRARHLAGALGAIELDREPFYRTVAPFALQGAFVRPIFAAHAVKTTEACRRLEVIDPDGIATYRRALLTLIAPRRPERFAARTAEVAARFLEDGRPPPGLY